MDDYLRTYSLDEKILKPYFLFIQSNTRPITIHVAAFEKNSNVFPFLSVKNNPVIKKKKSR